MADKKHGTKIEVGFPDKLELQMVQANELRHYELFQWLVSLLSAIAVGFWTGFVVEGNSSRIILTSASVFSAVSVLFFVLSILKRRKVFGKTIKKHVDLNDLKDLEN